MNFFIVRIELHNASRKDYESLHTAMQKLGFHVRVTHKGKMYHLPTAEYAMNSELTTGQVLESAKTAASLTGKKFSAIAVKCAEFEQFNLGPNTIE